MATKSVRRKTQAATAMYKRRLDQYGAAWARLLADPCNAPLTSPCYPSSGTGQFIRLHTFLSPITGSNNSLQLAIVPGRNRYYFGQTDSFSAGGTIGAEQELFSQLNSSGIYDTHRCIAACAKVHYVGAEQSRSGQVALGSNTHPIFDTGVNYSSAQLFRNMQQIARFGELQHEVKFIPNSVDADWQNPDGGAAQGDHAVLHVITNNTGVNTMVEVVAVYEVMYDSNSGIANTAQPSKSRNSVNEVLSALGPPAQWAFSNVIAPVMKSLAGGAVQAIRNVPNIVAQSAPLMITY